MKAKRKEQDAEPEHKLDPYFNSLNSALPTPSFRILEGLCLFIFLFGLLGCAWQIPVPKLISFNGYFNWASLTMAILIYYWYTFSPSLAYGMILIIALISYLVVLLNQTLAYQPFGWLIYILVFFLSAGLSKTLPRCLISISKKTQHVSLQNLLFIGPLWLVHFIYKRLKITF